MRKTSKGSKTSLKVEQPAACDDAVKVKAVNEMMERIKHGVVLRPVKGQDSKRRDAVKQPTASEEKCHESAMDELKGILETVKRSPSRGSPEAPSPTGRKDSELEVILRRRRNKAGEAGSGDERDGHLSRVSSCDSLNGRRASGESGKDADAPADERRGSGPAGGTRSDESGTRQERRSGCPGSQKATARSPVPNGRRHSAPEDAAAEPPVPSNGVDRDEDAHGAVLVAGHSNGGDAEGNGRRAL